MELNQYFESIFQKLITFWLSRKLILWRVKDFYEKLWDSMVSCARQLNHPHVEYKNLKYKQEGLKKKKEFTKIFEKL